MSLFYQPIFRVINDLGEPYAYAKAYFYATGTLTPVNVYTTSSLTTPHAWPVVADVNGVFPAIYFDQSNKYRLKVKDSSGNDLDTTIDLDPISGDFTVGTSNINNNAVTTAKIADGAVTSAKIADATITNADLAVMAAKTIKANNTTSSASPTDITPRLLNKLLGKVGTIDMIAYDGVDTSIALLCDGTAVSRTTYADLFTAIGTKYGTGDGSTTFNLPDFRGCYLRGRDRGRGYDSVASRDFGAYEADALQNITGTGGGVFSEVGQTFTGPFTKGSGTGTFSGAGANSYQLQFDLSAASGARTATETRVKNYAIDYMIYW